MYGADQGQPEPLPAPDIVGRVSLEKTITARRSVRSFANKPLTPKEIGQLCWAAQGLTDREEGRRASPSAGALYPIELYVVTANGVDHYRPEEHMLERHLSGDVRWALQRVGWGQEAIGEAPVCMVIAAVVERTARKYGPRAERYCFMEVGHVGQNILLQAAALHLVAVPVAAFEDDKVDAVLKMPRGHRVLYLLPVGHPRG